MPLTYDMVMAGNAAAVKQLVRERAGSYGKEVLRRVWGVRKAGGALELPAQAAADNPLLAIMWARFQESCRLFYTSGGLSWLAHSHQLCTPSIITKELLFQPLWADQMPEASVACQAAVFLLPNAQ